MDNCIRNQSNPNESSYAEDTPNYDSHHVSRFQLRPHRRAPRAGRDPRRRPRPRGVRRKACPANLPPPPSGGAARGRGSTTSLGDRPGDRPRQLGGGDQQPPSATVPVIDLGGDRAAVVDAVGRAAAEWGFFQVTGHGVPEEAMASAMAAVQAFHEAESGESSDKARL
ncbi:hypothetical protein HU200_053881 [Digitaria exilis]|uniref:Non-haem dioxygenase N-terminal domain-containing protein n=1 Tax=Digitaria exilis TaxID=1010633 RepID=A0A835ALZ9_9POAL|nr:hypothetical protein HU200_053881 [Digitaria exilis]